MGKEEFKAMVELIEKLAIIRSQIDLVTDDDQPRIEELRKQRNDIIIDAAQEVIDEPYKENEII